MDDKRFIEETFPVKEVSVEAAREKNIRHGHISTLHIWWSRKPLTSSRAITYTALIPPPKDIDEWNEKRNFIINFSKWENSLNKSMIEKARKDILNANGGVPPKVLDPFGGGGSIPLEALRLGCETYSNDFNPVAVFIQKCILEYPQKYGKPGEIKRDIEEFGNKKQIKEKVDNVLLEDLKKFGNKVLEEVKKEINRFYPEEEDGSIPVGYYWMRTIPCQNPSCNAEIPLTSNYWLSNKDNKKITLYPYIKDDKVQFKIVGTGYEKMPDDFSPDKGTISRAVSICLVCGSVVDAKTTRKLFQEGKSSQRLVAVILKHPKKRGKDYRIVTEKDIEVFNEAEEYLKEKREFLMMEWGMDPVPDEPLKRVPLTIGCINVWIYGMNTWGDLFNSRQKLSLITFVEKIKAIWKKGIMINNNDYTKAILCYLSLNLNRVASYCSSLGYWHVSGEKMSPVMQRTAIGMVFNYAESNPFSENFSWDTNLDWILRVIDHCSQNFNSKSATVIQSSATSLSYPDNFFDAVLTDPPYYDNVPYSYLSDFYYVWLKRTLGDIYPDLLSTPLTPKKNELVAYSNGPGGYNEGKQFFEDNLKKSFQEIQRVLKPDGIAVIVYAHKSTEGWETLINSLLESGLIMTGAWPLNTEMESRPRANESAALASSIYIIARKMDRLRTGFYNEVKEKLKQYLNKKLHRLWEEGVSGTDFFIAAIGSAIEVFGKYEKVMDYEGNIVRADRMLEDIRKIATDYAVKQILHNGFAGEITDLTRFYVLSRWNYGEAKIQFDDARKLAQSCGIDLSKEWDKHGFIKKEKEFIRVLGPQDRDAKSLKETKELIDVLHNVLLLWEKSKRDDMIELLKETGFGKSEAFFRVAQAISETLALDSKEKKLLDGFLAGKERLTHELKKETGQGKLF